MEAILAALLQLPLVLTAGSTEFCLEIQPVFKASAAPGNAIFVVSGTTPLPTEDLCLIPIVDGVSRQSELGAYLSTNPSGVSFSPDGTTATYTVPLSVLQVPASGISNLGGVAVALDSAFRRAFSQTRIGNGTQAAPANGAYLEWPSSRSSIPIYTFLNQQTPSITRTQAADLIVTFGSQNHSTTSSFAVTVNGNPVIQEQGVAALLANPRVHHPVVGVSGVTVRLDLSMDVLEEQVNRIKVATTNPDGIFSETASIWISKYGAVYDGIGEDMNYSGVTMTAHTVALHGPPNNQVRVIDPSVLNDLSAFSFFESATPLNSAVTTLDAIDGTSKLHLYGLHDFSRTGAPLVIRGASAGPVLLEVDGTALHHVFSPSPPPGAFSASGGSGLRVGGPARDDGMPGATGVTLLTFDDPDTGALAQTVDIYSNYTCKVVAEDEIIFGSNPKTGPVDVTDCLSHAIELLPNGYPHITSQLDEDCVMQALAGLLSDVDHVYVTFCKKPDGEPSYPDEVNGGTFHF